MNQQLYAELEIWIAGGLSRSGFGPMGFTGYQVRCIPGIKDLIDGDPAAAARGGIFAELREHGISLNGRSDHDIACTIAAFLTAKGKSLPLSLQEYVVNVARSGQQGKRGPDPYANVGRDCVIAVAVDLVCRHGKLYPTRNEASEHECGCSIVSRALRRNGMDMPEPTVVKAYQRALKLRSGGTVGKKLIQ
jgi:hypothetical protein